MKNKKIIWIIVAAIVAALCIAFTVFVLPKFEQDNDKKHSQSALDNNDNDDVKNTTPDTPDPDDFENSPDAKTTAKPGVPSSDAPTTVITLKDGGIDIDGSGVKSSGNIITIYESGAYELSGKLSNGQIVVNVPKTDRVYLSLNGVDITNESSAPFYVKSAEKVIVTLCKDTENKLTDGKLYKGMNTEGEPNACMFSKDDLTIKGEGALTVSGNYNNGICSKDDLKITGGTITVKAVNHGMRGNDSVLIAGGKIDIDAGSDGIKSTNEIDTQKGFITIEGGTISIKAGDDGIQAVSAVTISGGSVKTDVVDKRVNCDGEVNAKEGCLE